MFKDMDDQTLAEAISSIRALAFNASEIGALYAGSRTSRKAASQMGRLLRQLDIAVAIKRQRQRAGVWTLAN
jgi:hypothetical protein